MFGTICHFDPRPLPLGDEAVVLMEAVASLLPVAPAPPAKRQPPRRRRLAQRLTRPARLVRRGTVTALDAVRGLPVGMEHLRSS